MEAFDPARAVKADGAVGLRQLARATGSLISDVEFNGKVFVVSRNGRMVALLCPLPERTVVEIAGPGLDDAYEREEHIEHRPEWRRLGEIEKELLRDAAATHPRPWSPERRADLVLAGKGALGRLEIAGLFERTVTGGWRISREGLAAARALEQDTAR